MPDDAPSFLHAAVEIVAPSRRAAARQQMARRTLFDTRHAADAGFAGYDGPTDPDEGGFAVEFDGCGPIPSVVVSGSDGEITVCGAAALQQLAEALGDAAVMARRMAHT
jgi:hypothetical protein